MIDYSAWAEKPTLVTTLQLDAKNPRIPASGASREQRDLIAELVEHDKVYELAKEITDQGYVPVESLVAVIEDGKHVVLEGNRRLAALKLLIAPESAPDKWVKRFRSLSARVPLDSIKRVNVLYAPTRDAAAPFLMQKHTREQVERWSTIMQARFFRSLAQEGMKPTELAARYGRTAGEVAAFLRLDTELLANGHQDALFRELFEQAAHLSAEFAVIGFQVIDHQVGNVFLCRADVSISAGFPRQLADQEN